jgi:hypothetical protein
MAAHIIKPQAEADQLMACMDFFSILAYLKKLFPKSGLVFKYYQGSILSPLKGRLASSRPLNEQQVLLSNTLHAFFFKSV